MELQGRNLELNSRGEDVRALQSDLRRLGVTVDDPEGFFGSATVRAVQVFQREHGITPANGVVDRKTAQRINEMLAVLSGPKPYVVRGRVLDVEGKGVNAQSVRAFAVDLEGERSLGRTESNARGGYEISYEPEGEDMAIQVRVFATTQSRKPLVSSPLILDPSAEETINLAIGDAPFRGRPEFDRTTEAIDAEVPTANLAEMRAEAKLLLARKTGISEKQVERLSEAQRLAERTGAEAAVFYGLFQTDGAVDLASLLTEGTANLRSRLAEAVRENVLPASIGDRMDSIVEKLRDSAVDEILAGRGASAEGDVGALLATTQLSDRQKRRFLSAHMENEDPTPEFWNRLREESELNDAAVNELQLTLQLGALTLNHAPLVAAVRRSHRIADARELAGLDVSDWLGLMDDVEPPEGFSGSGRKEAYARTVVNLAAKAFPSARLLSKWTRDTALGIPALRTFVDSNPDFDFRKTSVRRYLAEHPRALDGIAEPAAFVRELEGMHRLFSLAPDDEKFEPVRLLWQAGLRSAHAVVGLGRGAFFRRFAENFGEETTGQLFARARHKAAFSLATLVKYSPALNGFPPAVIGVIEPLEEIPDWETLFGSLDFCECRHCRSVLSPAAYFVDLLQFLARADAGERSALDALLERRPDLAHIRLNCENTNTVLPYIDLVNEVLENAVTNGLSSLEPRPLQTTALADSLRANPQHVDTAAYNTLAAATLPWSLPFNLWHEVREIYLGNLGINVPDLMETFHREGEAPEAIDRAAAYLGLTRVQRQIVTGEAGSHGLGTSEAVLTLMRRSQTRFEQLTELLSSQFINPTGKEIVFDGDSCALEDATLDLTQSERDRLHRFRRLQKITGFSVFDLDVTVAALSSGTIDEAFLIQVAFLKRLSDRFRIGISELVSWWAPTALLRQDAEGHSLYEKLFLNPAVNNPLNPVEAVFRLAGTEPTELQTVRPFFGPDGNLDSEAGIFVAGALNLTEGELRLLVEQALPVPELNFRNLTHVQRVASLRRALGISIPEYLTLVRLTGEPGLTAFALPDDTLAVGSPEETRAWVEKIDRLREPGFTIAELDYILAHRFGPSFKLPLGDAEIGLVLRDLQTELRKLRPVAVGEAPPTQQQFEEIAEWLAGNLPRLVEDAEEALRIVRLTSALSQADQDAFVTEHLSGFVDAEVLAGLTAEAERLVHVYRGLVAFLSRTMTIQRLAAPSGLEAAVCEALVGTYLSAPSGGMSRAIEIFLADSFVAEAAGTGGPESMPAAYEIMRRLAKLGLVFSRLGIGAADIAFVFKRGPALGWYDIASLPVAPVAEGDLGTDSWMRLARALALSRRLFHSPFSLVLLIEAAQKSGAERSAFLALLAEQAGWEMVSLDFLSGPQGYSFSFPDDFADERWLERLSEAFKLIGRAGVSAAQIWSWNVPEADDVVARKIKNAAKARYGDEAWLAAAPELSDALRIRCRDALVDFLVAQNSTVADSDDLYERLLIDPAVQPCFLTSRIKQAISSVQLFVHRIFLGLGDGVRFEAADAAEWLWRKNYRIWEAARKIFLYPENFAEPELRGDKSPFFAELEENLLQGEVTAASVERAYLRYLRSLDEVARLEIAGLFIEGGALVHIFARTVGTPHVYYYRRYVDEAYFTPWEKVDVKIDGNHLLPVVYNRRLWLLWPVFTQRSVEPADLETTGKPQRYWEIKLAWTELSEGKWTSPRTSSDFISTATNSALDFEDGPASHFYFWARVKDGSLRVYPFFHRVAHTGSEDSLDPNQPNTYFRFKGCAEEPTVRHFPAFVNPVANQVTVGSHIRTEIPYRVTRSTFAGYQRFPSNGKLTIFSDITVANDGTLLPEKSRIEVLLKADQVNGRFYITPPHQYLHFDSQGPFFFEDELETFLIVPEIIVESHTPQGFQGLLEMNDVDLGTIGTLRITHSPALETVSAPRLVLTSAFATGENKVFTSGDERLVLARSPSERAGSSDVSEPHFDATIIGNVDADAAEPPKRKTRKRYHFHKFHHPKTCLFIEQLNRFGVDGLLNPTSTGNALELHRQPTLDFKSGGAYSDYNWEVFFHIPLLIADRLSQNQRFEEAQRWYHYIFDPTETDQTGLDPDEGFRKFWKIKPFFEFSSEASIEEIVRLINEGNAEYENEVARWEADPFNPHLVAKLRVVPYMKMVVLKYLDNLIAWADNLFRRDTIESINEATQLYVLAGNILGRKPVQVPGREATARTFQSLRASLDAFSNALVSLENEFVLTYFALPVNTLGKIVLDRGAAGGNVFATNGKLAMMPSLSAAIGASAVFGGMFSFVSPDGGGSDESERPPVLYFCVPNNQKLLDYFGTLADRLFKIRNCMNIEGVARSLALFEPPINPALLVKAAAAGIDLNSALDDLNAPLPYYRFGYMVQRTTEFCNEVKAVANALLSALEKQDAESLAALRAGHQADLLESARSIKERSIEEAKVNVESLLRAKDTIKHRREFYFDRESTNLTERSQLTNLETANVFQLVGQGYDLAANIAHLIPDFKLGVQGISSPEVTATFGGSNVGQALQVYSKLYNLLAAVFTHKANMAGIKAGHERRKEDWDFQAEQAEKELAQIDRQIVAAEIRVAMAERDLINHDRQIAHAAEEESFLSEKFTNTQLYSRMISQVSTAYFQSYQMAYDLANRAERCFRHELGVENTNFIKFGYWDNLTKGLHAADRLIKDVRRMEVAYIEQNQREYEITQHFSLALLNAQALLQLRENGACEFDIPELAFDLRYPGHYMRRIKSASVTIPCVVGPYTNVNATLSLLRNRVRISGNSQQDYTYTGMEDLKFRHDLIGVQSIATSSGQNDSGLFQLNFQDERYLPFERAGAISRWRLSLPEQLRPFDYNTISDAILHMSYTARDGGNALRDVVTTHVSTTINQWLDELAEQGAGLQRLISLKREFPNELHQLMFPAQGQNQATELRMSKRYFPYFVKDRELAVSRIDLLLKPKDGETVDSDDLTLEINQIAGTAFSTQEQVGLPLSHFALTEALSKDESIWRFEVTSGSLSADAIEDLYLLVTYQVGAAQ